MADLSIVPDHRVPKSVGYLRPGTGAWMIRAFENAMVDVDGVFYMAPTLPLTPWQPSYGSPTNYTTVAYVYKTPEGKMGVTMYFLGRGEGNGLIYRTATQDNLVGRDALIPFSEYREYYTNNKQLVFAEAGGPPVIEEEVKKPKVAATEGSATYQSRF